MNRGQPPHSMRSRMFMLDVGLTLLSLWGASLLRQQLALGKTMTVDHIFLPPLAYVVVAVVWAISFLLVTPRRSPAPPRLLEELGHVLAAISLALLASSGLLYLSLRDVSRLQFLYFVGLNYGTLVMAHTIRFALATRQQRTAAAKPVLLVGGGTVTMQLMAEFAARPWAGIRVLGFTSADPEDQTRPGYLGHLDATADIIRTQTVAEVIFTLPSQQQEYITRLGLQFAQHIPFHMVPSIVDLAFARRPLESVGGIPLIGLRESALSDGQRLLKRLFDVAASSLLLLICAPLMLIIAVLIKRESRGPVFFRQDRVAEHGQHFQMIKFRSMYADAAEQWTQVSQRDDHGQLQHKQTTDPRITPLGRRLRRTSLDELPQLFNVLRGDMSLVGPRPELPYIVAEYEPWQWQRFRVPAGMTGWWQVNGRSTRPLHLHTEDDLYYIDHYSFWLDLKILALTLNAVLKGQGAF